MGDAGLSGRKIIVDTYGGMARHGGGSFSGQGPDEGRPLGAPTARATSRKNVVAAGLARRFELQVAYAIGVAHPLAHQRRDLRHRGRVPDERIVAPHRASTSTCARARSSSTLDLRRPIYRPTAAYGHFGRPDLDLPWERTDRAAQLRDAAGLPGDPPGGGRRSIVTRPPGASPLRLGGAAPPTGPSDARQMVRVALGAPAGAAVIGLAGPAGSPCAAAARGPVPRGDQGRGPSAGRGRRRPPPSTRSGRKGGGGPADAWAHRALWHFERVDMTLAATRDRAAHRRHPGGRRRSGRSAALLCRGDQRGARHRRGARGGARRPGHGPRRARPRQRDDRASTGARSRRRCSSGCGAPGRRGRAARELRGEEKPVDERGTGREEAG